MAANNNPTADDLRDPIQFLADSGFAWGKLAAIHLDRSRTELFPEPYLVRLYDLCKQAGRGKLGPLGILPQLFCGMRDLSCEAVVAYLYNVAVVVVGEWREEVILLKPRSPGPTPPSMTVQMFHPLGFTFPSRLSAAAPQHQHPGSFVNAIFAGYGFFDDAWGQPAERVLMYLGLAYLFHEGKLAAIHGTRYHDNHLTARFCRQFGFVDTGRTEFDLLRHDTGLLGPSITSTLTREVFSELLREVLSNAVQPEPPTAA